MMVIASSAQMPSESRRTRTKSGFSLGQEATATGAPLGSDGGREERGTATVDSAGGVVISTSMRGTVEVRDSSGREAGGEARKIAPRRPAHGRCGSGLR